ncbi:class I SAM-dependent methyltransferase [Kangiella sediminilitoris]|uniref:Thiopurine S-methyltransferase n=1 Tax=Kangiella sediminilitoris TaxID=1144748 RepID=A0A1B3B9C8_9GAMM|nr:hypothetical protein [Kangiella sediminilitoris]AOE49385.1 Thiopurine S-methyltransferase [Kangiella sediminilitoris]
MDYDFWNNCWLRPTQPFHLSQAHHFLVKYYQQYFDGKDKVLLPLCGKTRDLLFLSDQKIDAVGVEFNQHAVEEFWKESGIRPEITKVDNGVRYDAAHIHLWLSDFFQLHKKDTGSFQLIFDRAAIVALPLELRHKYASHLESFLSPDGQILLVTMDYDPKEMSGPPFCISERDLHELFPHAEITELDRHSILDSHPRWKELELSYLNEILYKIRLKH